jgi:hypothetical protein
MAHYKAFSALPKLFSRFSHFHARTSKIKAEQAEAEEGIGRGARSDFPQQTQSEKEEILRSSRRLRSSYFKGIRARVIYLFVVSICILSLEDEAKG